MAVSEEMHLRNCEKKTQYFHVQSIKIDFALFLKMIVIENSDLLGPSVTVNHCHETALRLVR